MRQFAEGWVGFAVLCPWGYVPHLAFSPNPAQCICSALWLYLNEARAWHSRNKLWKVFLCIICVGIRGQKKCSINGGGGVLCFKSPYLSVTGGRLSALDLRRVFIAALLLDFFLWVSPDLLWMHWTTPWAGLTSIIPWLYRQVSLFTPNIYSEQSPTPVPYRIYEILRASVFKIAFCWSVHPFLPRITDTRSRWTPCL